MARSATKVLIALLALSPALAFAGSNSLTEAWAKMQKDDPTKAARLQREAQDMIKKVTGQSSGTQTTTTQTTPTRTTNGNLFTPQTTTRQQQR